MIAENSPSGTNVGMPVTAVDLDESHQQQVLTYAIGESLVAGAEVTDDDLFDIDRASGQITVSSAVTPNDPLDSEEAIATEQQPYIVLVTATDPSGLTSSVDVTIMLTPVMEAPEILDADATNNANLTERSVPEHKATTSVSSYEATDDETANDDELKWSLSGSDEDMFVLCEQAAIATACGNVNAFRSSSNVVHLRIKPSDYEQPADSGRNNVYNVTVTATDSDMMTVPRDVTVTVTNVEEPGTVTLSNRQPEVGTPITATLTDPDRGVTGVTWQWYFGAEGATQGAGQESLIRGATSPSYTPVFSAQQDESDVGRFLRAVATYTDRGPNPEADDTTNSDCDDSKVDCKDQASARPVQAEPPTNATPQFADEDTTVSGNQTTRYILENSAADKRVVVNEDGVMEDATAPVSADYVTASDADTTAPADVLTYTLSGRDASSFEIDRATGEVTVGKGTKLDFETKSTYTVIVTATDSSLASDSITVTIIVKDANEAPVIMERGLNVSGPASATHPENSTAVVGSYSATGPRLGWRDAEA